MLASTPTPSRPVPAFGSARAPRLTPQEPRRFVDSVSRAWTVREVAAPDPRLSPRPTCLVFETEGLARRVWQFAADWQSLADGELEALSERH